MMLAWLVYLTCGELLAIDNAGMAGLLNLRRVACDRRCWHGWFTSSTCGELLAIDDAGMAGLPPQPAASCLQ